MKIELMEKDKFFQAVKKGVELSAYLFVTIVVFYVLLIVLEGFGNLIIKHFGIKREEIFNFGGTLISGVAGVVGGIYATKAKEKLDREIQVKKLKNQIKTCILQEINHNNSYFYNFYNKDEGNLECADLFKLTDWERIKYDIYLLSDDKKYEEVLIEVNKLYKFLERANQLTEIKIDIDKNSMRNLRSNIKDCLTNSLNKIKELFEN